MKACIPAMASLLFATAAIAAPQGDWPCVQRKVDEITAAAIGAPADLEQNSTAWQQDPRVAGLVGELAARRLPVADAEKKLADFVAEGESAKAKLPLLLAGLLDHLNAERGEIITGIERYGHKQKLLAERLRKEMHDFDKMRAAKDADPIKIGEINDQLVWDTRIFDERQKSLSYVCEVPVLIEQRLFALGRTVLQAMN